MNSRFYKTPVGHDCLTVPGLWPVLLSRFCEKTYSDTPIPHGVPIRKRNVSQPNNKLQNIHP